MQTEKIKNKFLSKYKISSIEKDIKDKKTRHLKLFEELDEIQRPGIESYKLDSETQKVFDNTEQFIIDNYLGINGVDDVFTDNKFRKVIVLIDENALEDQTQEQISSFVNEIKDSVDLDVYVDETWA